MRDTSAKRSKRPAGAQRGRRAARWTIGVDGAGPDDGVVALTLDELRRATDAGAAVVRLDDVLMGAEVEPADEVLVRPSMWRGHAFIGLCEWLVCAKLARDGARVVWQVPARGGATGVRKTLEARGWSFTESKAKDKRQRLFEGCAPAAGEMPGPRTFDTTLGPHALRFEADWGVFSLGHVDEGTRRLFDAAHARTPSSVADIGTGYGAVALGLTADGARVIASDVDLVALALARRNAAANGLEIELVAQDDPTRIAASGLTTCEIPTHVPPGQTRLLVDGLASRARNGVVLVAVHNTLIERYSGLFGAAGARVAIDGGDTHAILELSG